MKINLPFVLMYSLMNEKGTLITINSPKIQLSVFSKSTSIVRKQNTDLFPSNQFYQNSLMHSVWTQHYVQSMKKLSYCGLTDRKISWSV